MKPKSSLIAGIGKIVSGIACGVFLETMPMPELFIARALGETSTIRMGPVPVCLNQHPPRN